LRAIAGPHYCAEDRLSLILKARGVLAVCPVNVPSEQKQSHG
jgi:hypothetical protein